MEQNTIKVIAGAVLLAVVGGVYEVSTHSRIGASLVEHVHPQDVTISGLLGGEKLEFVRDPAVAEILRDRYGISINARRAGSLDMVMNRPGNMDFIWPANDTELDLFNRSGAKSLGEDNVFSSPIVILSWKPVVDALQAHGIVHTSGDHLSVDLPTLIAAITDRKSWSDFGLSDLTGAISVKCTYPGTSNSGNSFAALVATELNHGVVPTMETLPAIGGQMRSLFERLGRMDTSSGEIFQQFVTQGVGAFPLVVGYENQIIEFMASADPETRKQIASQIRLLYPEPTTWATHPIIALSPNGLRLLTALRDPEIRKLAWNQHGFRIPGASAASLHYPALGVASSVGTSVPLPSSEVNAQMIKQYIPEN